MTNETRMQLLATGLAAFWVIVGGLAVIDAVTVSMGWLMIGGIVTTALFVLVWWPEHDHIASGPAPQAGEREAARVDHIARAIAREWNRTPDGDPLAVDLAHAALNAADEWEYP